MPQDPQAPVIPQTLPIDPATVARVAQMLGGAPQQIPMPGPLPATSPVNAGSALQQANDINQENRAVMQQGAGQEKQAWPAAMAQIPAVGQRINSYENTPMPFYGPRWSSEEATPPAHPLLHNILTAIERLGMATEPGQTISGALYGPEQLRYRQELAQQMGGIDAREKEQQATTQAMEVPAGMAGKAVFGTAYGERGLADVLRAENYGLEVGGQNWQRIQDVALKSQGLKIDQVKAMLEPVVAQIRAQASMYGAQAGITEAQIMAAIRGQIENVAAQTATKEHPISTVFTQALNSLLGGTELGGVVSPQTGAGVAGANYPKNQPKQSKQEKEPKRPKGVPANAVWNAGARQWQLPKPQ